MKINKYTLLMSVFMLLILPVSAATWINIDFTRDSTFWRNKFPAMTWNTDKTDFFVGGINDLTIDGFTFKGAYGKFNPGSGNYNQPIDREDYCNQYIYSFRVANTGNSYISFPEVPNAGQLTIHCKSGNVSESAVFYIEKYVDGKWVRIRTLVAPAHANQDYDVVLRQNININAPVKLRIYGASKNLHVYTITLKEYDSQLVKEKGIRLIVLPDTQNYIKDWPYIFQSQTAWIVNNADSISYVIHVGDITNANNANQWPTAVSAMSLMDNNVSYTFCPGNHDIGTNGSSDTRNTTLLNQYMPYSKYSQMSGFGGVYEAGKMDNSWHTFSTPDGYNFLIVSLEFGPRNGVLEWAGEVIKAHPLHNVIINTHAYLYSDDKRISAIYEHKWTPSSYGLYAASSQDANDGEEMWTKLVKLYPNIFMVVCGHVLNDGTGLLVSDGDHGNKVYQMLANYQTGVVGTENGGNGFLRIIDIDPLKEMISVKSYSPFLYEYKTEDDQQFSFNGVNLIKSDPSQVNAPTGSKLNINVSKNILQICTSSDEILSVKVVDTVGKTVYSEKKKETRIVLPEQKGCYIVQVSDGKEYIVRKVIIR
ncbi:MAG: metallophosphoesterase [Paludibacter sp.]|nr:metallophosphoesterase [Paludibacter sp.]